MALTQNMKLHIRDLPVLRNLAVRIFGKWDHSHLLGEHVNLVQKQEQDFGDFDRGRIGTESYWERERVVLILSHTKDKLQYKDMQGNCFRSEYGDSDRQTDFRKSVDLDVASLVNGHEIRQ